MLSNSFFLKQAKKITVLSILIMGLTLPIVAAADMFDFRPEEMDIDVVTVLNAVFGIIWPIVVTIIILAFVWAGVLLLTAAGDPGKINTARSAVFWGIIGVVVIIMAFSIIGYINGFFAPAPAPPPPPAAAP